MNNSHTFPFQVKITTDIHRNIFELMLFNNGKILENFVTLLTVTFSSYAEKLAIKDTCKCYLLLKCNEIGQEKVQQVI